MKSPEKEDLAKLEAHIAALSPTYSLRANSTPVGFQVEAAALHAICLVLRDSAYFDYLACLSGVDQGPEAATMEVVYHLYALVYGYGVALYVSLPRETPEVPSVSDIWRAADWHEREAYDLLGIGFTSHPDLRRILLPDDWQGHPLRKDYQTPDTYQGIKIDY